MLGSGGHKSNALCDYLETPDKEMLLRNLLKVGQPSSADLIWVQRPNNKNQFYLTMDFAVAQMVKNLPAVQENRVRSLGWEDPLEKGLLQYSCLENAMDRGAWRAAVHGITKSWPRLRD